MMARNINDGSGFFAPLRWQAESQRMDARTGASGTGKKGVFKFHTK
jgi:hypothetical protein